MLAVAGLALLLGLAVAGPALARGGDGEAASVEVRIWQNVDDERDLYVSARAAGGSWRTLGTVPLALDGLTARGSYRYGDIALAVPEGEVDVRVWQHVDDERDLYVSARVAGGSWRTLGTVPLVLDGLTASGSYRYGDIALAVPQADGETVAVEVRVWQNVDDERDLYVSTRPVGGSWPTLGTVPLALDSLTASESYRYGDITFAVPQGDGDAEVEVRVWQDASLHGGIFVSVRSVGGAWSVPGTAALPLDDGIAASGRYRYGDVRLAVPPKDAASGETARPDASRSDIALPSMAIRFEGDFQGAERAWTQELEKHFNGAAAFFAQRYGLTAPGLVIRMVLPEKGANAMYGNQTIFMPTNNLNGTIMAHEYVHALQDRLSAWSLSAGSSQDQNSSPPWIIEGMATYFDQKFSEAREERIVSTLDEARMSQDSLRSMEINFPNYPVSSMAIHQLVLNSGEMALFNFYSSLKSSTSWQESFKETFGMAVDEFYEKFASYRADVAPSIPQIRGVVSDPDGNPVSNFEVRASRLNEDHLGDGRSSTTDTYGRFTIPIKSGKYVLDVRHPDCGDAGFLDDDGSFTRSWEEARIFEVGDSNVHGVVVNLPADPAQPCAYSGSRWWAWWMPPVDEPERMSGVGVAFFAGLPGAFTGMPRLADGPAESARFSGPMGMALTASGDVIVADFWNHAIRRIAPDGMVATVAGGNGEGARDGPGEDAQFAGPADVAVHADGSIYVADSRNGRIRRIGTDGVVTTVAGSEPLPLIWGGPIDGLAAEARFLDPFAIAFDRDGNLLIADRDHSRIRKLSPAGRVSTLIGPAAIARPTGIAIDSDGTIFFTGGDSSAVGKIDDRGNVSTVLETIQGGSSGGIAVGPDALYVIARPQHVSDTSDDVQLFSVDRDGSTLSAIHVAGAHSLAGVVRMDDGALLVSDAMTSAIWRITFDEE